MFQVKKVGARKYIGEWFQENLCWINIKVQFHRRRLQSKVSKNFKSVTTSTFGNQFVRRTGFIVKTWCLMSCWSELTWRDDSVQKMNATIVFKQCNPWQTKKVCFLCPLMLTSQKLLNFQLDQLWTAFSKQTTLLLRWSNNIVIHLFRKTKVIRLRKRNYVVVSSLFITMRATKLKVKTTATTLTKSYRMWCAVCTLPHSHKFEPHRPLFSNQPTPVLRRFNWTQAYL